MKKLFLIALVMTLPVLLTACSSKEKKRFATVGDEKIVPKDDGSVEVVNTKTLDQHLQVEREAKIRAEEERDYYKKKVSELEKENYKLRSKLGMKGKKPARMPQKFDEKGNVTEWDRPKDSGNVDDEMEQASSK
jgi:hypothetical protein